MRKLTKFLIFGVCLGLHGGAVANVATTAGSNLTAYNGSGATNNNNWNNFANARGTMDDNLASATNDNCEAVILRCATKKCSSGGCTTMDVTRPIVGGCVNSNQSCKVHGDTLIDSIAGQLVAKAMAKADAQRAQAEAAAAQAAAQSNNSNAQVEALQAQIAEMQNQMQSQMDAVQTQVQQQGTATAEAIAAAQAQANAAQAVVNPAANYEGLSQMEQIALQHGVDSDILARETIMGKIVTSMEETDLAVQDMKKTMNDLFQYAGCDTYANNCSGPNRVKRFKELANDFFTPYNEVGDKLYDALVTSMTVGIDVSDALMLMNGACNMWGKYVCDACTEDESLEANAWVNNGGGARTYSQPNGSPFCVCTRDANDQATKNCYWRPEKDKDGKLKAKQPHCRLVNMVSSEDEVKRSFIENSTGVSGAERVECASDVVFSSGLFKKRNKKASIEDIEILQRLVNQDAYRTCKKDSDDKYTDCGQEYCEVKENSQRFERLQQSVKQKKLLGKYCYGDYDKMKDSQGGTAKGKDKNECEEETYFAPEYALCTVHTYNTGKTDNPKNSAETAYMKEVIALKSTVIAQQIREQYEMISAIVKRLKTQLEKSVYTTKMDILAGAESSATSGSSTGGIDGAEDCQFVGYKQKYECIKNNMQKIVGEQNVANAKNQYAKDYKIFADMICEGNDKCKVSGTGCKSPSQKKQIDECAKEIYNKMEKRIYEIEQEEKKNNSAGVFMRS